MNPRRLTAVFFGSYSICYKLTSQVVSYDHAFCDHEFDGVERFNTSRNPSSVVLRKFDSFSDMLERMARWSDADVLVVAGFGYRLPLAVIQRFKWVINMHPGDLWNNRGATPLPTDILRRNPFFTVSLHVINSERLDSGPFISSVRFPACYQQDFFSIQSRQDYLGGTLLVEVLQRLMHGFDLGAMPWNPPPGSYQPRVPLDTILKMAHAKSLNLFFEENPGLVRSST